MAASRPHNITRYAILAALALLLAACAPAIQDARQGTPIQQPQTPQPAPSEKAPQRPAHNITQQDIKSTLVNLIMGETKKLDNGLTLSFTKILSDSRCPPDTDCIHKGNVTAQFVLRYTPPPGSSFKDLRNRQTVEISTAGEPLNAWQWEFKLAKVSPPKRNKTALRSHEYSILMAITEQGTQSKPIDTAIARAGEQCGREKHCAEGLNCSGFLPGQNNTCIAEQEAKAACKKIDGVWRRWGRAGTIFCNPRLPDSNQVCNDDAQCEGYCIADTPQSRSGHCQELKYQFGCFTTLRSDERGAVSVLCID